MIIESVDTTESQIALFAVLSDEYLGKYIDIHNPKLIQSDVNKAVLDICINHWGCFREAPKKLFGDIVETAYDNAEIDGDEYDLLKGFDKSIDHSTDVDSAYFIQKTTKHLKAKYNELFITDLKDTDDDAYNGALQRYAPPTQEKVPGIYPFQDKEAIMAAGRQVERKQLIKFPGALGYLLNRHFVNAAFVCFFAPAKRGKSWWLAETSRRALFAGRGVWTISIADMIQDEVLSRFGHMQSGLPVHDEDIGVHYVPVLDCILNQTNECTDPCDCMVLSDPKNGIKLTPEQEPDYIRCTEHCDKFKGTTWSKKVTLDQTMGEGELVDAWDTFKKRTKNKKFRIFTTEELEEPFGIHTLEKWWDEQEKDPDTDWLPEVIVVDYLDLAEDDQKHFDDRARLNKVFMKANAFAKKHNVLFITASQTNAEGLTTELVTEENFSGDKRKLDHITAGIGLNQTPAEKDDNLMRLNVFIGRHAHYNKLKCIKVIQDLKLGKVNKTSYH